MTALPASITDLEQIAARHLPRSWFEYFAGGSGAERTMGANIEAWNRLTFDRRVLVGAGAVDTEVTVLGRRMPFPVLLAPVALQRMAHADGEVAAARAAAAAGVTMVLSTLSTTGFEAVADCGVNRWFQLYIHRDRALTAALVAEAEAHGFSGIVLTVDTPQTGRRERDERNAFTPPASCELALLHGRSLGGVPDRADTSSSLYAYFAEQIDPTLTWDDVEWLRGITALPILLKGVVSGADARMAADAGLAGVIVSNHGGRQLDGDPATADALEGVVAGSDGRIDVLVDGGIRRGADILRALALGARAVLIGRPLVWGLVSGGEAGVGAVLELLRLELELAMRLAGVTRADAVPRTLVRRS